MTTALIIFAWRRPEHLERCLEAVKRNRLIPTYIFLDGGYTKEVFDVAENNMTGNCIVAWNEEHLGLTKSIFKGIERAFNLYDSVIVLEDDILIADNFIEYMLEGLEYYKDKKDIGTLTGYNYIEHNEVYGAKRFTGWGWATWKDRWEEFNQELEPLDHWGEDIPPGFDRATKTKDTWDYQFSVTHNFKNWKCVHPPKSLVKNIGMDGSGTHFKKKSTKFDTELSKVEPDFKYPLEIDERIRLEFVKKNKLSLQKKIINFLKSLRRNNEKTRPLSRR